MRLIAMSYRHQVRHYSTLLLPYKINTIRKKTKGLIFVSYGALGRGLGGKGKDFVASSHKSPCSLLPHLQGTAYHKIS